MIIIVQDDIVFNENRHLLYNLLDNYFLIGDSFWDNPLHTMLVSCTFSFIYAEGFRREAFTESCTLNDILNFIGIPNLTIKITYLENSRLFYSMKFYYQDKFFTSFELCTVCSFKLIHQEVRMYTYRILMDIYYSSKLPNKSLFDLRFPTNYSSNEFNSYSNNISVSDMSWNFLHIYGSSTEYFGKIFEYKTIADPNKGVLTIKLSSDDNIIKTVPKFLKN